MQCPYCLEQIIDGAKLCRFCGKTQVAEKARRHNRLGVVLLSSIGVIVVMLVSMIVLESVFGPQSLKDEANIEKANCIANKGDGYWTGSSGMTLARFCEASAALKVLEQDRKDHPERY
jgi:hypothetical protein